MAKKRKVKKKRIRRSSLDSIHADAVEHMSNEASPGTADVDAPARVRKGNPPGYGAIMKEKVKKRKKVTKKKA